MERERGIRRGSSGPRGVGIHEHSNIAQHRRRHHALRAVRM